MIAKKSPLVSVIIPIHNRFALVDEAVQSVTEQTHHPIELILVDDHSDTPYTPKIPSEPGFDIRVYRHEENKGPGTSRETGRQAATGDFIAYLDSDDLWHPQKLEKQVVMLQTHPEAGMCYCQSVEFSSLPLTGSELIRHRSDKEFTSFLPTVLYGRPWGTGACLWTRKATDKIGPWSDGWTWEDYEYDCRAGCLEIPIVHLPTVLCYFRKRYGESQLSLTPKSIQLTEKAKAILSMSKALQDSKKINDTIFLRQMVKILHTNAMELFLIDEKEAARRILQNAIKISNNGTSAFFRWIYAASYIFPSHFCSQIMYKFKRSHKFY